MTGQTLKKIVIIALAITIMMISSLFDMSCSNNRSDYAPSPELIADVSIPEPPPPLLSEPESLSPDVILVHSTQFNIYIDSEAVQIEAYLITDDIYLNLRNLASALADTYARFDIVWHDDTQQLELVSGVTYAGELTFTGGQEQEALLVEEMPFYWLTTAEDSTDTAQEDAFVTDVYIINDEYYISLFKIAEVIGFDVQWDREENTLIVDTSMLEPTPESSPELSPEPSPSPTPTPAPTPPASPPPQSSDPLPPPATQEPTPQPIPTPTPAPPPPIADAWTSAMIDALIADMYALGFESVTRSNSTAGAAASLSLPGFGNLIQNSHSDSVVRVDAVSPINPVVQASLFFNIRHRDIEGASGVALVIHSPHSHLASMKTSSGDILFILSAMV
jgi:hypothetical protein